MSTFGFSQSQYVFCFHFLCIFHRFNPNSMKLCKSILFIPLSGVLLKVSQCSILVFFMYCTRHIVALLTQKSYFLAIEMFLNYTFDILFFPLFHYLFLELLLFDIGFHILLFQLFFSRLQSFFFLFFPPDSFSPGNLLSLIF